MGTRSLTRIMEVIDNKKEKLVTMYCQMDGYPTGHGLDLAEFLESGKIVDGIKLSETNKVFNGIGCLAASMIAHFKRGTGSIYIYNNKVKDAGQNYEYHVICDKNNLLLECFENGYINNKNKYINRIRKLFSGTPEEFIKKYNKNA